jgi:dTDP-4-dehydrorhamnose reductase
MRILITGGAGQLGTALQTELTQHELFPIDLPQVDITDREALFANVADTKPDLIIHCAAYTNVDGCAKDPALAYKVNGLGTQNVALACQQFGATMVHISTNEVFAGDNPAGYEEWMPLSAVNAYGRSKAAAEVHVKNILSKFYIVRPAWLYAPHGRNFIHAILDRARSTGQLRVVTDEIGNPTYAKDHAQAIGQLIETEQYGIYHFVNSAAAPAGSLPTKFCASPG